MTFCRTSFAAGALGSLKKLFSVLRDSVTTWMSEEIILTNKYMNRRVSTPEHIRKTNIEGKRNMADDNIDGTE